MKKTLPCLKNFNSEISFPNILSIKIFDFQPIENATGMSVRQLIKLKEGITKENAKKYKVDENTELIRVIIHGLLHLIGYKDKTKKEKTLMSEKENKYLSLYKQK